MTLGKLRAIYEWHAERLKGEEDDLKRLRLFLKALTQELVDDLFNFSKFGESALNRDRIVMACGLVNKGKRGSCGYPSRCARPAHKRQKGK